MRYVLDRGSIFKSTILTSLLFTVSFALLLSTSHLLSWLFNLCAVERRTNELGSVSVNGKPWHAIMRTLRGQTRFRKRNTCTGVRCIGKWSLISSQHRRKSQKGRMIWGISRRVAALNSSKNSSRRGSIKTPALELPVFKDPILTFLIPKVVDQSSHFMPVTLTG